MYSMTTGAGAILSVYQVFFSNKKKRLNLLLDLFRREGNCRLRLMFRLHGDK